MKRPIPLLLLPFLLIALLFAACKPAEETTGGPTVVRFWNGFTGPDGETMRKIVRSFNASQKEVQVEMEIIPWGTFYDKLTLGLAFGGAPDIFVLHTGRFPEFASHGVLSPIRADLKAAGLDQGKFPPRTWEACRWEGEQYALPLDVHPMALYYNTELFEKAGIKEPPKTYAEFLDIAHKLTVDKNGDGKPEQWGFAFTWLASNSTLFMNQHGSAMLTPDLKRSAMGTPEARAAFTQMTDIIYKEKIAPKPEGQDAWLGFQTGKVAMALEGVYMMAGLERQKGLKWAAAPVPQFGPVPAVWGGSHLLALPKESSPRKREAAWKFAKYLSDNSIEWAKGGQVPARKDLVTTPEFQALKTQSIVATQVDQVVYEPASVALNLVATFKDSAVEKIVNRIGTMDEAIEVAERRTNVVLARQAPSKQGAK